MWYNWTSRAWVLPASPFSFVLFPGDLNAKQKYFCSLSFVLLGEKCDQGKKGQQGPRLNLGKAGSRQSLPPRICMVSTIAMTILHPGHWEAGAVSASLGGQFAFSLGTLVKPSNKTNYGYQAKPSHLGHILSKMCLTDEGGYLTGGGVGKNEFWPQPRVIPASDTGKKKKH